MTIPITDADARRALDIFRQAKIDDPIGLAYMRRALEDFAARRGAAQVPVAWSEEAVEAALAWFGGRISRGNYLTAAHVRDMRAALDAATRAQRGAREAPEPDTLRRDVAAVVEFTACLAQRFSGMDASRRFLAAVGRE